MLRQICFGETTLRIISLRSTSTKSLKSSKQPTKRELLLKLRNSTGYPLISCKDALTATSYDIEQAKEYLLNLAKEKGWNKMQDISQKLNQGLIGIAKNKKSAAIVEVNCGTDFVAKTQDFQLIVKEAADLVLQNFSTEGKMNIPVEELLNLTIPDKSLKLQDKIAITIGKLKEAVVVRRACVISAPPDGAVGSYIHPSILVPGSKPAPLGSFASLAAITCTNDERTPNYIKSRGRDVCQHIVGMRPTHIGQETNFEEFNKSDHNSSDNDLPQDAVEDQVFPLPDMSSNELLRQPFLLDSDICVEQWLEMSDIKVHDFVRFQVGDFSEETDK